jgi:hypothetical protein
MMSMPATAEEPFAMPSAMPNPCGISNEDLEKAKKMYQPPINRIVAEVHARFKKSICDKGMKPGNNDKDVNYLRGGLRCTWFQNGSSV